MTPIEESVGSATTGGPRQPVSGRGWYRAGRWLAVLAAAALILFVLFVPLLGFAGRQMVQVDPPERSDAMLVLASSLDRIIEAADLYQQGYAPVILLTQTYPNASEQYLLDRGIDVERNEERRERVLEALGVPGDSIMILPGLVDSTADEARVFADWSKGRSIASVMIVTSVYHTGRTRLTFERTLDGTPIVVRVHPSSLVRFDPDAWWRSRDTLRTGIIEFQKLVYYRLFEL